MPPGTHGISNTTILSTPYNNNVDDVAQDLNVPRPIVAGGTGAATAAQAMINLGGLPGTGGTLTGNLIIQTASNPSLVLNKNATSGQFNFIWGQNNGVPRWRVSLGNNAAETGSNSGSDFDIFPYDDSGNPLGSALTITRSSRWITTGSNLACGGTLSAAGGATITGTVASSTSFAITPNASTLYGNHLDIGDKGAAGNASVDFYSQFGSLTGRIVQNNNGPLQFTTAPSYSFSNNLSVTGTINATGSITASGALFASGAGNVLAPAGSPVSANFNLYDSASNFKGSLQWYSGDNSVRINNSAASAPVILTTAGVVQLGTGMQCRNGNIGSYSSNCFNSFWTGGVVQCWIDATNMGNFSFSSDYRIKKDVVGLSRMWDIVKELRPIKYTQAAFTPPANLSQLRPMFPADNIERWGFIAHELQATLIMDAATGVKDSPDTVQSPNPWTVIAALTKALQEAMTRIEALEAR